MGNSQESLSKTHNYKFYDVLMALFVTVLLMSNLLSSAKIIDFGFSLGPLAFILDAGTLVFPISYIFGDVLTEVYGYQRARRVIWTGFMASFFMGFMVFLVGQLPSENGWSAGTADSVLPENVNHDANLGIVELDENGQVQAESEIVPLDDAWRQSTGDNAYRTILGGISGLIVASLAAYFVGEFLNSYVLAKMKIWSSGKRLWTRTIGSTIVGQAADTTLFFVIATLLGVFSWDLFVGLVVSNYVFKVMLEVLMTPITYRIVSLLKQVEREDYYDYQTNFNPFRLGV